LGAKDEEVGFSKAAIRSRKEPGLGLVGGCAESDIGTKEEKEEKLWSGREGREVTCLYLRKPGSVKSVVVNDYG
jgi:hypothetical protein